MANTFNRFFDKWNMATVLRVLAVLLFVFDISLHLIAVFTQPDQEHGAAYYIGIIFSMLLKDLYQPVVLLGLAELIRNKRIAV